MAPEPITGIPIFCVQITDKKSQKKLFVNFKSNDSVQYPDVDLDEDQIVKEICNPTPRIELFKIPLKLSPIFWSKGTKIERSYVIDVLINDKFAIRRVLPSEVIRHYVVNVTMETIEQKYNNSRGTKGLGQFIGHNLDLDQTNYEVLISKQCIERSDELVNNKIILLDETMNESNPKENPIDTPYDLYYRPASGILTCSIVTDKLPDSISFNDDRIVVKSDEKFLVDAYLPFYIDLSMPVKYKYDDRLCLLRIVFKVFETLMSVKTTA